MKPLKTAARILQASTLVLLSFGLMSCSTPKKTAAEKEAKRASVGEMASQTLNQLYAKHPEAKNALTSSAGYAVFSDFGFKVWTLGGANGKGMAVNNSTKKDTFMKMMEFQPGMGLGASKFRLVFLFDTEEAYHKFVSTEWELGANAMATAKTQNTGGGLEGATQCAKGVKMYQLDESGLIVGVSLTAARFSQDKELN